MGNTSHLDRGLRNTANTSNIRLLFIYITSCILRVHRREIRLTIRRNKVLSHITQIWIRDEGSKSIYGRHADTRRDLRFDITNRSSDLSNRGTSIVDSFIEDGHVRDVIPSVIDLGDEIRGFRGVIRGGVDSDDEGCARVEGLEGVEGDVDGVAINSVETDGCVAIGNELGDIGSDLGGSLAGIVNCEGVP